MTYGLMKGPRPHALTGLEPYGITWYRPKTLPLVRSTAGLILRAYNPMALLLQHAYDPSYVPTSLRPYASLLPYDCPMSLRPYNLRSYCTRTSLRAHGLTNSLTFLWPLRTTPLSHQQKALTAAD